MNFREKLANQLVEWTKPVYVRWFKQGVRSWKHDQSTLLQFPEGSLGRKLGEFLESEQLKLMPKLEDHDVMHVLMEYKSTVVDEVRMQFFLLGNGKKSMYALCTAIIGLLIQPEYLPAYWKEFKTGRYCLPIAKWDFQYLLHEPVLVLRNQIFRREMPEEAPLFI